MRRREVAIVAREIGLCATTSLGGLTRAAMKNWGIVFKRNVVALHEFDEPAKKCANEVAQLWLAAVAGFARIVTLPGSAENKMLKGNEVRSS